MPTLSRICPHTQGAYFAFLNSEDVWARYSERELAAVDSLEDAIQADGSELTIERSLISDTPWFDNDRKWNLGVRIVGSVGDWEAVYVHSGQRFCVISDSDVATIGFAWKRKRGQAN